MHMYPELFGADLRARSDVRRVLWELCGYTDMQRLWYLCLHSIGGTLQWARR